MACKAGNIYHLALCGKGGPPHALHRWKSTLVRSPRLCFYSLTEPAPSLMPCHCLPGSFIMLLQRTVSFSAMCLCPFNPSVFSSPPLLFLWRLFQIHRTPAFLNSWLCFCCPPCLVLQYFCICFQDCCPAILFTRKHMLRSGQPQSWSQSLQAALGSFPNHPRDQPSNSRLVYAACGSSAHCSDSQLPVDSPREQESVNYCFWLVCLTS